MKGQSFLLNVKYRNALDTVHTIPVFNKRENPPVLMQCTCYKFPLGDIKIDIILDANRFETKSHKN